MIRGKFVASVLLTALLLPGFAFAQSVNNEAIAKIKDEGMNRSEAMKVMRYLSDVIGARLTNSPSQRRANRWTKEQFEKWGLKNAVVNPWGEFGKGWELKKFTASVITPDEYIPFRAFPKAWSPSTNGAITGDVIYVDATDEAGLEKYKGKLKGAIVLTAPERPVKPGFDPTARRQSDEDLSKMEEAKPGAAPPQQAFTPNPQMQAAQQFNARKNRFYFEEGVAVLVEPSNGTDAGTIRVMGANPAPQANAGQPAPFGGGMRVYSKDAPPTIPQLVAEVEQYNRLVRLAKQNISLKMAVELDAKFYTDDLQGYNTIAEIPGTDLKDEVVMIGAHLDSWHAGTGATDNGAGTTVVMEAMRILQASGLKPRRTIRVALWTGEEQGLLGSRGYVTKNLASVGDASGGAANRTITKKPAHDKFAAYYNLDNGTGQIRGIYMQGNEALRPIFKEWLTPFKEYNATTVTVNSTGGTDHLAFDGVGLPGFQFIQDPVEYTTRTWHTTQDVADRTIEEDLKRSAIIMATFAYNSAMSNEKLPRKSSPNISLASLIGGYDWEARLDETAFYNAGLNHSVCGHIIESEEIPNDFPRLLTFGHNHTAE